MPKPRMTRDIDLVVVLQTTGIDSLMNVFTPQYYVTEVAISEAIHRRSSFNLIHVEAMIKIDCIIQKKHPYRELEFQRRQLLPINGIPIYIVSKEDLILSKLYWGKDSNSEMQLGDVRNLMASGYDQSYTENWLQSLGIEELYQKCLS